jgi:hypothetical protein
MSIVATLSPLSGSFVSLSFESSMRSRGSLDVPNVESLRLLFGSFVLLLSVSSMRSRHTMERAVVWRFFSPRDMHYTISISSSCLPYCQKHNLTVRICPLGRPYLSAIGRHKKYNIPSAQQHSTSCRSAKLAGFRSPVAVSCSVLLSFRALIHPNHPQLVAPLIFHTFCERDLAS